jgi:hypothetical protein
MPDANYAIAGIGSFAANTGKIVIFQTGTAPTVSLVRVMNDIASNGSGQDCSIVNVSVFR